MNKNSLTLLAVLSLAISNLLVGLVTKNTYLVLASSGISAVLAGIYFVRGHSKSTSKPNPNTAHRLSHSQAVSRRHTFPLWVFVAILFIALPILMVFLQSGLGTA